MANRAQKALAFLVPPCTWLGVYVTLSRFSVTPNIRAARAATELAGVVALLLVTPWALARWIRLLRPSVQHIGRAIAKLGAGLLVLALGSRFAMASASLRPIASPLYAAVVIVTAILVLSSAPIGAFHVGVGLFIRLRARWRPAKSESVAASGSSELTRRQLVEGAAGGAVLAWTGGTLTFGALRGRFDIQLEEIVVRIPGLPKVLDGYTLAQISDIHAGVTLDEAIFTRAFEILGRTKADLVVATGDLVDSNFHFAPRVARELSNVGARARDGVFAILGNHDYFGGFREVWNAMSQGGVRMLVNRGADIRANDGGGFALLGVDDAWAKRAGGQGPDLAAAIRSVRQDTPRILLSHQPDTVEMFGGEVALQLSGHTHGGQYNPGFTPLSVLTPYVTGRYAVKGTTLYVNRGIGTTAVPSRVGAAPEITKIVLVTG